VAAGPEGQGFAISQSTVEFLNPDCSASRSYAYDGHLDDSVQRATYVATH
jgi:hypothetical protein